MKKVRDIGRMCRAGQGLGDIVDKEINSFAQSLPRDIANAIGPEPCS
jgi:hypothetical protein